MSLNTDIPNILVGVMVLEILGALVVLVIVLAAINYHSFRYHYKTGLLLGAIVFEIAMPPHVMSMYYLDVEAMFNDSMTSSMHAPGMQAVISAAIMILGTAILIGKSVGTWSCITQQHRNGDSYVLPGWD